METSVVVIGRGVNDRQMAYVRWQHFILDLVELIERLGGQIYTQVQGVGYGGGGTEGLCVISFGKADLSDARHELARLASEYDQGCIVLIIGTCELVSAWTS
jgi:hypothetical protein